MGNFGEPPVARELQIIAGHCAFLEEKAERRCNAFGDCNENELHRSSGVVNSGKANVIGLSPGP